MGEVRYERVGAAALLTIDRPERRNAVDAATALALREGFESFEADDGARTLVLTGAHDPQSSHYQLLRAFVNDDLLSRAVDHSEREAYLGHEFGDSWLIV